LISYYRKPDGKTGLIDLELVLPAVFGYDADAVLRLAGKPDPRFLRRNHGSV
jgi:hypothetical protein